MSKTKITNKEIEYALRRIKQSLEGITTFLVEELLSPEQSDKLVETINLCGEDGEDVEPLVVHNKKKKDPDGESYTAGAN